MHSSRSTSPTRTNLTIDAGPGSDEISLNNPNTPTGLTGITVNGGDPTAGSDTAIISGTTGANAINFAPTTDDDATVTGAGPVTITLAMIENAVIDGQGGNDNLTYTSPAGQDRITYTPGDSSDEATITADQQFAPFSVLMPVSFTALGNGSVTIAGVAAARTDSLQLRGTDVNDAFTVSAAGVLQISNSAGISRTLPISTPGVANAVLQGLDGDDTFAIPGNHPFPGLGGGLPGIIVEGGNPDNGSDTLNFNGAGAAVTVNLSLKTITETGFGAVSFSGIESVNVDANGAALTVTGTAGNDTYDVTPFGAGNDGSFTHNLTSNVAFAYDNSSSITFDGGAGGDDVVQLRGDEAIDLVTATATTVTIDGSTVTIGAGIEELDLLGLGGDDNINLTGFNATTRVEIYGGDGNDTIRGSELNDITYGGAGNDTLIGGTGSDTQYGEEGNDVFGNPGLAADGVADDPGTDFNFGGPGFDNFIWEPGDGPDFNNGGDDGADIFRFFGSAAANTFTLRPGGTPTHFNALIGALVIDNHGIEDVIVDGRGGGDTYVVNDLFPTEVVSLNLVLGAAAVDTVTVNGRNVADNLNLTSGAVGQVSLQGLRYNVNLTGAEIDDLLTINGNDGDDVIQAGVDVEGTIRLTLNGGAGNDTLDVHNTVVNAAAVVALNGNEDNDTLIGGLGDESMDGGGGDDTFIGNGGTDAVGGGVAGLIGDTILVPGTPGDDVISLELNAVGHLLVTVNGVTTTYTNFVGGAIATSEVDLISVVGGQGDDTLTIDSTNGAIPIAIEYDGGTGNDFLTLTGGTATSDTYQAGPNPGQGISTIVIGGVTQTVSFQSVEPVLDLVAGPLLVVATAASNAINYSVGGVATNGLVTIDNFETIEFSNKIKLTINCRRQRRDQSEQSQHTDRPDRHHGQRRRSDRR